MAQVTITIPDPVLARVLAAVCGSYGYDAGSGLTQAQFTKQQVLKFLKDTTVNYEANNAASTAANSQRTQTTSDIQLT